MAVVLWDLTGPQLGVNTGRARACILVMYSSWDCELEEEEGWVGTPRVAESSRVSVMVGSRARDRRSRLGFILENRVKGETAGLERQFTGV